MGEGGIRVSEAVLGCGIIKKTIGMFKIVVKDMVGIFVSLLMAEILINW